MDFEFLPTWLKAVIGCGVILFIGIAGFSLTSKSKKGNSNSSGGNSNSN